MGARMRGSGAAVEHASVHACVSAEQLPCKSLSEFASVYAKTAAGAQVNRGAPLCMRVAGVTGAAAMTQALLAPPFVPMWQLATVACFFVFWDKAPHLPPPLCALSQHRLELDLGLCECVCVNCDVFVKCL